MNDPEVMERIAAALEKIAWILGGSEWLAEDAAKDYAHNPIIEW